MAKLFPNEPYDDVNFRKYCSDLLRLVGAFMAQEIAESDETKKSIGTLTYAVQNRVEPLLSTTLRQARAVVEEKPYRSLEDFLSAYSVERQYYALMEFDVKVNTRANLEEISLQLDLFYWIEKLKLFSSMLSQQRTGNYQYDLKFMGQILEFLQGYPVEEVPELAIYYYSFLTLYEAENVSHYYNLRRLLDTYATVMPQKRPLSYLIRPFITVRAKSTKATALFCRNILTFLRRPSKKEFSSKMANWQPGVSTTSQPLHLVWENWNGPKTS
ncbi:MAG: hypothetical protein IPH31_10095 [Lewinellaceae bacterium]|nr:hypothetical protein [Lewinellaceae bacterium]